MSTYASFQLIAPELFQSVEVLNGASAFLNGAAPGGTSIGGSVNLQLKRAGDDPLTDVRALGRHVRNWRALLRVGLEAMDDPATVEEIEARTRTGRPLASPEWIADAEAAMSRKLGPQRRGPKVKRVDGDAN